jgi:integrase
MAFSAYVAIQALTLPYCERSAIGAAAPLQSMDFPVPDNNRGVYAKLPELSRLWRAFDDDEAAALFRIVFYMGLRWRAELLTRTREHIVRNGRDVWLKIGRTKNGEQVMKYVHPAVLDCLDFIPFERCGSYYYADRWHPAVQAIGRHPAPDRGKPSSCTPPEKAYRPKAAESCVSD